MAVRATYDGVALVFDGQMWTSELEVAARLLNQVAPDVMRSYWSDVSNATESLRATFGPDGWEITSFDPEPFDPGFVY